MHFSDCYKLASKIQKKDDREELIKRLKSVETVLRSDNFMDFLKEVAGKEESSHQWICNYFLYNPKRQYSKTSRLIDWSFNYDYMVFNKAVRLFQVEVTALEELIRSRTSPEAISLYSSITCLLKDLCWGIDQKIKDLHDSIKLREQHFQLIKKYASHALPLCGFNDPFKYQSSGCGLGWSDKYGSLVSTESLHHLSTVLDSDLQIFEKRQKTRYLVNLSTTELTIWDAFSQLNTTNIISLQYLSNSTSLSTIAMRMVGSDIELYDSIFGLMKFNTRQDAADFLSGCCELLPTKSRFHSFVQLPYKNNVNYDVFSVLPDMVCIEKQQPLTDLYTSASDNLNKAFKALSDYADILEQKPDDRAKIKSHEIKSLVAQLRSKQPDDLNQYLTQLLQTRNHPLMLNRGTGFYFLTSGLRSHSHTETLLIDLVDKSKSYKEEVDLLKKEIPKTYVEGCLESYRSKSWFGSFCYFMSFGRYRSETIKALDELTKNDGNQIVTIGQMLDAISKTSDRNKEHRLNFFKGKDKADNSGTDCIIQQILNNSNSPAHLRP
ncbi:MAG: hypothetical protein EBY16_03500 [Gammaproteobacteria bacterium]|nr:hypothetical protein [Gammaproteobacteria bacterium]